MAPLFGPDNRTTPPSPTSSVARPTGLVPSAGPPPPNYSLRASQIPPHHCHAAVFHHSPVLWGALRGFCPPSFLFTLLSSGLPPSILPSLQAYVPLSPPGRGCRTSPAAAPAKNRCPRNTSPARKRERAGERGSTWRQIRWTGGSAVAVWKCGIPFRDLKSCVAKLMVFVFRQYLGLFFFTES